MRSRQDHRPNRGKGEALELGGNALDRASRLGVRVEQVARDQHEVDLLGEGEIDRRRERSELTLALGGRLFAEVRVTSAEMDVRRMEKAKHAGGPPCSAEVFRLRRQTPT